MIRGTGSPRHLAAAALAAVLVLSEILNAGEIVLPDNFTDTPAVDAPAVATPETAPEETSKFPESGPIPQAADRTAITQEEPAKTETGTATAPPLPRGLPTLNHVETYFRGKGQGSEQCQADWQRFRKLPVTVQAPKLSYAELEAKAKKAGLSAAKFKRAYDVFRANQNQLPNQKYISVIDFDRDPIEKRLFIINLNTGEVERSQVANGMGSGALGAVPDRFSNTPSTRASSLGCAVMTFDTNESGKALTDGDGRPKLMLHGFESTNDKSCDRLIFMHSESYASPEGRSHGCPAVPHGQHKSVFDKLKHGGLMCSLREKPYKEATKIFAEKKTAPQRKSKISKGGKKSRRKKK